MGGSHCLNGASHFVPEKVGTRESRNGYTGDDLPYFLYGDLKIAETLRREKFANENSKLHCLLASVGLG